MGRHEDVLFISPCVGVMAKTSLEAEESFMNSITKSGKLQAEKSFRPVIVARCGFYAKKTTA